MFSFPLYTTKGLEVKNVKGGKGRVRKGVGEASERHRANCNAHISQASLTVSGMVAIIIHSYQT